MQKIYLDQASTSFPKAPGTAEAVFRYMTDCGCNVSRGGYTEAYSAEEMVYDTRTQLCRLFAGDGKPLSPKNVLLTKNVTESLNILIKGLLKPGDHVLVSSMEHNAVMRPLNQLAKQGIRFTRVPCGPDGSMDPRELEKLIEPSTRAVIMLHASNVCGTVLPAEETGRICRDHGLTFILDTAQTAGVRAQGTAGPSGHRRIPDPGRAGGADGSADYRRHRQHQPHGGDSGFPAGPV